jgi:membrane protein
VSIRSGFFGVILGLLAWLALHATVIVFAIEVDAVRARRLWPRSTTPPPLTDADKAYYASVLRAEVQRPEQRLDLAYGTEETDENAKIQTS